MGKNVTNLYVSGRPFGNALNLLNRLANKSQRNFLDYEILTTEEILNYELSFELIKQLFTDLKTENKEIDEDFLNVIYSMPLFLSEEFAKNWEHEQPWKDYPVSDNDKTYMAYYIESKKPTFAYLPETNNNYKKIWNYFFKNASIEEFIYIIDYSIGNLKRYRLERNAFLFNPLFKNIEELSNKLKLNEDQKKSLYVIYILFNFKYNHTNKLLTRLLKADKYNGTSFFNRIEKAINCENNQITKMFTEYSILVKSGIFNKLKLTGNDFDILKICDKNSSQLWENIEGPISKNYLYNSLYDLFSLILKKDLAIEDLNLSNWNYIEILNNIHFKIKTNENIKLMILGKKGTGKTTLAINLIKNSGLTPYYIDKDNKEIKDILANVIYLLNETENAALIIENSDGLNLEALTESNITVILIEENTDKIELKNKNHFDYVVDISDIPFDYRLAVAKKLNNNENVAIKIAQQMKTFSDIAKLSRLLKEDKEWDKLNKHIYTFTEYDQNLCNILSVDKMNNINEFAGYKENKKYFDIIYDLFNNPIKYQEMSVASPKGFLISGEPGTGKTLFAKHIAKKINLPMVVVNTTYLVSNIEKIKDVFDIARNNSPCILFFDEIDSLLTNPKTMFSVDTNKQKVLNTMLSEIDGVKSLSGVLIIGTTNHFHNIAPAAKRSGRLSENIEIRVPTYKDRKEIWESYLNKKKIEGINIESLVLSTEGFTGADINEAVNQACLYALFDNENKMKFEHLDKACEIILWGRGNDLDIKPNDLYRTAVHETGHAVLAMRYGIKVNRVTIIPRQGALGVTHILRDENKFSESFTGLKNRIAMLLGGIIAEKVIFGEYEAGGTGDLYSITNLTENLFMKAGFSKTLGFSSHSTKELWSEKRKFEFEEECTTFINEIAEETEKWINSNKELIKELANEVLDKRSLTFNELTLWEDKIKLQEINK